jgi:zinc-ribbon domain
LTACQNCGREMPQGALFCPDCGAAAVGSTVAQTAMSPSHFNSGMTATSPPLTTEPAAPPPSRPEERKPSYFSGRRGTMLVLIAVLAALLVFSTFETGLLGSPPAPVVNSASDPLTGGQLFAAYAANQSKATASYTNKTVYIKDSLDFGVGRDLNTGQYYSSVDSGNVILFWSTPSQLGQLTAGSTVLAKCSVDGVEFSPGAGNDVVLVNCALVSVQSTSKSTSSFSVANE